MSNLRCERCDRPVASMDEHTKDLSEIELYPPSGDEAFTCTPINWRERALAAERERDELRDARSVDGWIIETALRQVESAWPSLFARNLAVGAALCRAFTDGLIEADDHRLYHEHGYRTRGCWSPGCGRRFGEWVLR